MRKATIVDEPLSIQVSLRPGPLRRRADARVSLRRQRKAALGFEIADCGFLPFRAFSGIACRRADAWLVGGFDGAHALGDPAPRIRPSVLAALAEMERALRRSRCGPRAVGLNEVDGRARELGAVQ